MAALAEILPDSVTSWRREKRGEKSDECWQPGYLPVIEIRTFTCRRKIAWKWVKIHCSPMIRIVTLVRAAPSKCPARDFLLFCLSFCVLPAFPTPSPPFLLSPLHFFLSWEPGIFPSKRRYRIHATFIFRMARVGRARESPNQQLREYSYILKTIRQVFCREMGSKSD